MSKHGLLSSPSPSPVLLDPKPKPKPVKDKNPKSNWDWGDTIITWATHHQQLLTMKECSRGKVLKRKKSQYDPPYPSRWSVGPGGQRDQEHGVVLHVQGEGYQEPITFRSGSLGVDKYL